MTDRSQIEQVVLELSIEQKEKFFNRKILPGSSEYLATERAVKAMSAEELQIIEISFSH